MTTVQTPIFTDTNLFDWLTQASAEQLDALAFGVIGIDAAGVVTRYNAWESSLAGLPVARVVGRPLFALVAPCMNNALVAMRLDAAADAGLALDVTLDYVLTLRMLPVKVSLRLLARPGCPTRYVLVRRPAPRG